MKCPIISVPIEHEQDVVLVRRRARQIAEHLRFDAQEQSRVATAVSEIARNAFTYAGGGRAEFSIERDDALAVLSIRIIDNGPGIENLEAILGGTYRSNTGMGMGILGARRLMDRLTIDSQPGAGTVVTMFKDLPPRTKDITPAMLAAIAHSLTKEPQDIFEEVRSQNQDLLRTLEQVREGNAQLALRQEDLLRLNRELDETNRGVVALYAELD